MSELATRRDFLMMAGMGAAGATLVRPSKLFAQMGAAKPEKILVAADAHPAIQSAAKILAKKLGMDESAIATYDGAPKADCRRDCAGAGEGWEAGRGGHTEDGRLYRDLREGGDGGGVGRAAAVAAICGGRTAALAESRRPCRTGGIRSLR